MKQVSPLTALLLALLTAFHSAAAQERFSPHQRVILDSKSAPPVDASFSFDAPSGPQFSEAEKAAQRERGKLVLPMVRQAFASGAAEVRIPPGDYCFGQERDGSGLEPGILRGEPPSPRLPLSRCRPSRPRRRQKGTPPADAAFSTGVVYNSLPIRSEHGAGH